MREIKLSILTGFIVFTTYSCSKKNEMSLDPQIGDPLSQKSESEVVDPIIQDFTGDYNTMVHHPSDAQDEALNLASQAIMEALSVYVTDLSWRKQVIDLAQSHELSQVSIEYLIDTELIDPSTFHASIETSSYYTGSPGDVASWIESSYHYEVQHKPVLYFPNIENLNKTEENFYITTGLESNTDFTDDDNGLVYVKEYQENQVVGEYVINYDYALSTNLPIFVVSPGMEAGDDPELPNFTVSMGSIETGDSSLFKNKKQKLSTSDNRPLALYEQKMYKRFERWGGSEIGTMALWSYQPSVSPGHGAIWNDTRYTRWYMGNTNQWYYRWKGIGTWRPGYTDKMTWNVYEWDWQYSPKVLNSIQDNLPGNTIWYNYGKRKYYSEVYAFSPKGFGANYATPYPHDTYHPWLWATAYINSSNATIRVWRVQ